MIWILCAFLSAALLGFYDAVKKHALRGNAVVPVLWINTALCALFFLPAVVLSGLGIISPGQAVYVSPWEWQFQRYVLLKAAIVLSSWICGYYAMKHLPLTIVGPINASRPVMVILGALLIFGEKLNLWQWAGVSLSVISFFLLSRAGKREGIKFGSNRWIYLLVAAALLGAGSGLYDKFIMSPVASGGLGLDKLAVQSWCNIYQCVMMGVPALAMRSQWRGRFHRRRSIVLISVFLTLADLAYFYALSQEEAMISVVSMVRRGSVVVSFACGALFFGEKNLRTKAVDLVLVVLGMVCLGIGTLR